MWLFNKYVYVILSVVFLQIMGCGSDDADTSSGAVSIEIAGVWTITETDKTSNCAVPNPETFDLTVTQDGTSVTIVDPDGNSFAATLSAYNLSWSGSYADTAPDGTPGTTTITLMSADIDASCNSLTGTVNWTWTATDGGGLSCSGTTAFIGSRTPASGCGVVSSSVDGSCDIVANPDGPAFFKVQNNLSSGLEWYLPDYAFAADMKPGECTIMGVLANQTFTAELQQCTIGDEACITYFGPTEFIPFTLGNGETFTLSVDSTLFD